MKFNENLTNLRLSKGTHQKDLAQLLKVSIRQYQRYEKGEQEPSMYGLSLLSDFFDVSIDYLLGKTDDPKFMNDNVVFIKELPIQNVHEMKINVTDEEEKELKAHLEYLRWKEQMKKKGHNL